MKAFLEDLENEHWFRWRNKGVLVWETEDGKKIPIKDMKLSDLLSAIRCAPKATEENDDPFDN